MKPNRPLLILVLTLTLVAQWPALPAAAAVPARAGAAPAAAAAAPAAAPDPLTCAGYPDQRLFLDGQAWWQTTPGKSGPDFGHAHIGLCFPYKQTIAGQLDVDVRYILHDNPGNATEFRVEVKHGNDYIVLYQRTKVNWTCAGTCERWEHLTLDTTLIPTDGIKEFIFSIQVAEPDGKRLHAATVWRAYVQNGRTVDKTFTDYQVRASALYHDFGYSYSRLLSDPPLQPLSGVQQFHVHLRNGPKPVVPSGLRYDVLLDADFHNAIPGKTLRQGSGEFEGLVTVDTRTLTNGPHRLLLRMFSDDGAAGSTLVSVLVVPFKVENAGGITPAASPSPANPSPVSPTATPSGLNLAPGQSLVVNCPTRLELVGNTLTCLAAPTATKAATNTPSAATATPQATQLPTNTPPGPTATKAATNTPLASTSTPMPTKAATNTPVAPTATQHVHATPTSAPTGGLEPVAAEILGTCSAAVHDRYTVTGPDGQLYRTWHPPVVPVDAANPGGPTCAFAHEHGDDPTTSLANPALPAFGYINAVAGHPEAHEGFKVFVANRGARNDEGRVAQTSTRIVFHMGTGGVKRYTMPHHSLIFDLVAPDGHYVHVQGLADSKLVGSICDRDRALQDSNPNNDVGRTVMVVKGAGCDVESVYEIWSMSLNIANRVTVNVSTAAFDPITTMNPADMTQLIYTYTQYPGDYHGCNRESYHGPVYWYNANGPTVYYTDAFGARVTNGPLKQEISKHSDIGIPMSQDQTQFKLHAPQCVPGLGLKN